MSILYVSPHFRYSCQLVVDDDVVAFRKTLSDNPEKSAAVETADLP